MILTNETYASADVKDLIATANITVHLEDATTEEIMSVAAFLGEHRLNWKATYFLTPQPDNIYFKMAYDYIMNQNGSVKLVGADVVKAVDVFVPEKPKFNLVTWFKGLFKKGSN